MILTPTEVQELVERMVQSSGRRIYVSQPFVEGTPPQGDRLHVVFEGDQLRVRGGEDPPLDIAGTAD